MSSAEKLKTVNVLRAFNGRNPSAVAQAVEWALYYAENQGQLPRQDHCHVQCVSFAKGDGVVVELRRDLCD